MQSLWAQKISVTGQVTDIFGGSPLPGVAVLEKNGSGYSVTDLDGKYSISVPSDASLVFSCLGMQEQTIAVKGRTTINVAMTADVNVLDDVLVVAYGTSTKESFTGSAETIRGDKLRDRPVADVSRMLDGQMSGVMTTSGSGQPGSGSGIMVRGFGSINASSSPLIVVDGIPYDGSLNSLNPNDIESMSVLKDASAGALYGSRGANGVVIVTTKSGGSADERISIDFTARVGFNSMAISPYETVNASQYMEQMYRATYNDLLYTEGHLPGEAAALTPSRLAKSFSASTTSTTSLTGMSRVFSTLKGMSSGTRRRNTTLIGLERRRPSFRHVRNIFSRCRELLMSASIWPHWVISMRTAPSRQPPSDA